MFLEKHDLENLKIVPVVTAYSVEKTVETTRALVAGGINSVEITLRTDCALDAIKAVQDADIDVIVGVGTVTTPELVEKVAAMNVDFAVSPGITTKVLDAARDAQLKLLPGVGTTSELMFGMEYGYKCFKLFPASVINALGLLKAFNSVFPDVNFCPTGGISELNAREHLDRPNVGCVGGSWMIPKAEIDAGNWAKITELSQRAMAL